VNELDLTEAIKAGTRAMWSFTFSPHPYDDSGSPEDQWCENTARAVLSAAAPILERQVREKIAQEIEVAGGSRCPVCGLGTHLRSGPQFWCQNNHMWNGWLRQTADEAAAIARGSSPSSSTEEKGQR
jgi:hypothetical protein